MRHRLFALLAAPSFLLLSLCSAANPTQADVGSGPAAPGNLAMLQSGSTKSIPSGSWIANKQFVVKYAVQDDSGSALIPDVEIEPANVAFTGQPNFQGQQVTSTGPARVTVRNLTQGVRYHWQARVEDTDGNASSWVAFGDGSKPFDIAVDLTSPSRPTISSPTNPSENRWYNNRTVILRWSSHALSGIAGYTYVIKHQAGVIPPGAVTSQTQITLSQLPQGTWFLALRSVNKAGTWSPTATYRIQLDRTAPRVSWLGPSRINFNPLEGPLSVAFAVNKPASVQLRLFRVGSQTPTRTYWYPQVPANQRVSMTWSGKDAHGKPLPAGFYFFSARAQDIANNVARLNLGAIQDKPVQPQTSATGQVLFADGGKRIIVSLSRQTLYAYDGSKLVLQTYVTTGNPSLPTPAGNYTVMAKYHPYEFISPWPVGSPYYYAPSWSNYAMLFRDGGYFLHDAPWRSAFGPGTNGVGQPGTNYGGTHGCINIPPSPMLFLWNWTPVGTVVQVVP